MGWVSEQELGRLLKLRHDLFVQIRENTGGSGANHDYGHAFQLFGDLDIYQRLASTLCAERKQKSKSIDLFDDCVRYRPFCWLYSEFVDRGATSDSFSKGCVNPLIASSVPTGP